MEWIKFEDRFPEEYPVLALTSKGRYLLLNVRPSESRIKLVKIDKWSKLPKVEL